MVFIALTVYLNPKLLLKWRRLKECQIIYQNACYFFCGSFAMILQPLPTL